jgi:uncharacterized cupin superfamily protein
MPSIKDIIIKKPTPEETQTCKTWPIWQGEPSTFNWDYTQAETCLIIEGKATITARPATEESVTIQTGDLVIFPDELKCIWKIEQPIKKHYDFT